MILNARIVDDRDKNFIHVDIGGTVVHLSQLALDAATVQGPAPPPPPAEEAIFTEPLVPTGQENPTGE